MNAADGAGFIAALKIGEIAYCNLDEVLEDLDPEVNGEINIALERAEEVEENRPARKTVSGAHDAAQHTDHPGRSREHPGHTGRSRVYAQQRGRVVESHCKLAC